MRICITAGYFWQPTLAFLAFVRNFEQKMKIAQYCANPTYAARGRADVRDRRRKYKICFQTIFRKGLFQLCITSYCVSLHSRPQTSSSPQSIICSRRKFLSGSKNSHMAGASMRCVEWQKILWRYKMREFMSN